MQSLTSKGYVHTQFSWQYYYYSCTPEGVEYLRNWLHLPQEIVPATYKKQVRPPRPAQVREGGGFRGSRGDRGDRMGEAVLLIEPRSPDLGSAEPSRYRF